jgi:hypothetical protein
MHEPAGRVEKGNQIDLQTSEGGGDQVGFDVSQIRRLDEGISVVPVSPIDCDIAQRSEVVCDCSDGLFGAQAGVFLLEVSELPQQDIPRQHQNEQGWQQERQKGNDEDLMTKLHSMTGGVNTPLFLTFELL